MLKLAKISKKIADEAGGDDETRASFIIKQVDSERSRLFSIIKRAAPRFWPAVELGLMAATTILEAGEDHSYAQLQPYSNRLTERFGTVSAPGSIAPQFLRNYIAGALLENKWFTRHAVLDRWFLHTSQTALYAG